MPVNLDDGLFYYPQSTQGLLPDIFNESDFSKVLVKWAVIEVRPNKLESQPVIFNIFDKQLVLNEVRRFTCQDYLNCPDGQFFWGGKKISNSNPRTPYDGSISILNGSLVSLFIASTKGELRYTVYYNNEYNQTILITADPEKFPKVFK